MREDLQWILKYSDGVETYLMYFHRDYEDFLENEMFQDCCLAKIAQIAECLNRIDKNHPGLYDRFFTPIVGQFHGMRDITIHQYENIDFRIFWVFLTEERLEIATAARRCLDYLENPPEEESLGLSSRKVSLLRNTSRTGSASGPDESRPSGG